MLPLMQEHVHEDLGGTVVLGAAIDFHLAASKKLLVTQRVQVLARVSTNPAPVVGEVLL